MEQKLGFGFQYQPPRRQSSYLNVLNDPLIVAGQQNSLPACLNPYLNPANGFSPLTVNSCLPSSKPGQPNVPFNQFYYLPRYRQAFASPLGSVPKDALASEQIGYHDPNGCPMAAFSGGQKRFLVFDQSGNQTTLIYNSAVGTPVQCLASRNLKPPSTPGFMKEDLILKGEAVSQFPPSLSAARNEENPGDDLDSEMHEDTEEINALLFSDDENDSEDDEVTSTGHSPSTMTDNGLQQWSEDGDEEVASSASPVKRQKLIDGEYDVPPHVNADGSVKPFKSLEFEDDAESHSGNSENQVLGESLSGKKRSRNDKIRKTISVLRNIIPGLKGEDTLAVIDGAIHYLKSLKVEVQSLDLEAL